jgi:hypothetical protein
LGPHQQLLHILQQGPRPQLPQRIQHAAFQADLGQLLGVQKYTITLTSLQSLHLLQLLAQIPVQLQGSFPLSRRPATVAAEAAIAAITTTSSSSSSSSTERATTTAAAAAMPASQ